MLIAASWSLCLNVIFLLVCTRGFDCLNQMFHYYDTVFGRHLCKSKKTLFNVEQCKQYNISSHLKWVLVADIYDISLHGVAVLLTFK